MKYKDLNINQKINFKSWYTDMVLIFSARELRETEIPKGELSITGVRKPGSWQFA